MAVQYRKYPAMTLDDAVSKLEKVYEKAGRGPTSKISYIEGLGYRGISGASSSAFAALLHYGFIEKTGQGYKITELGMHILRPEDTSDESVIKYMQEAALNPALFSDIYDRYVDDKLPGLLQNILVHDFNVYDKSGKDAADKFKQALEVAKLIDENGVILRRAQDAEGAGGEDASSKTQSTETAADSLTTPEVSKLDDSSLAMTGMLRELPSGIKIAFPKSLDTSVLFGEFGAEMRALEERAQSILAITKEGASPDDQEDKETYQL